MCILLYYDLLGAINILPVLYLNSIVFNVISVNDNLYYFINESKLNETTTTHTDKAYLLLTSCTAGESIIDQFLRPCLCYQLQSIEQNMYVLL